MASPSDDTGSTLRIVSPADDHTAREFIDELALASRLGLSRSTLQSWRYAGRGPRFVKLGRLVRYRSTDVEAFLLANTRGKIA